MNRSYTLVHPSCLLPSWWNSVVAKRFEDMTSNLRRCGIAILLHANGLLANRLWASLAHVLEAVGIHDVAQSKILYGLWYCERDVEQSELSNGLL